MGRTLHYKIFCDEARLDAAWPKIERMQDAMNRDFSWSCETLALEQGKSIKKPGPLH